ncbi:AbrB family transcriptional regulator [bacterium]|nr:AbrB family transcriptional regulator [bacterium]
MPKLALSSILIVLGLHIGNYIDQNLINQMTEWVWTSIIMFVYILISILIVSKYLQKFSGYNVKTSSFCSYRNFTSINH